MDFYNTSPIYHNKFCEPTVLSNEELNVNGITNILHYRPIRERRNPLQIRQRRQPQNNNLPISTMGITPSIPQDRSYIPEVRIRTGYELLEKSLQTPPQMPTQNNFQNEEKKEDDDEDDEKKRKRSSRYGPNGGKNLTKKKQKPRPKPSKTNKKKQKKQKKQKKTKQNKTKQNKTKTKN